MTAYTKKRIIFYFTTVINTKECLFISLLILSHEFLLDVLLMIFCFLKVLTTESLSAADGKKKTFQFIQIFFYSK